MKILAIVNPISGGESKQEFLDYLEQTTYKYGINTEILETSGKDDFSKIKSALMDYKPDLILAVGGDGTFALTALAAVGTKTNVGIIPLGSANGMAKELGVNQTPNIAFDDLLKSRMVRQLDVIDINEKAKCIHLADIGLNARVVKAFDADDNRGMLTYGKYLARELQNSPPINYKVEANGETIKGECVMIIIANGKKYGTGVSITETGNPFDGVFELVIVEEINLGTIVKAGLSIFDQIYADKDDSSLVIKTSKAKISFQQPQLLQADGEVIGEFEELNIKMLSEHVNFLTTSLNSYISVTKVNSKTDR